MPDYLKGKIYLLICNITGLKYIGCSCEPILSRRLALHVKDYKRYLKNKRVDYKFSFRILENNDYNIILLEKYPCESRDELLMRERHYIETIECVNKSNNPNYVEQRVEVLQKLQETQDKQNNKVQCECGGRYTGKNKTAHLTSKKHTTFLSR
jgi:hypothetical protein